MKSKFILSILLLAFIVVSTPYSYAEVGYRCLVKEPVLCVQVVPQCIKLANGDYDLEPNLSEECFDKTICYKNEITSLNSESSQQKSQLTKLQEENKKLKSKLRLFKRK